MTSIIQKAFEKASTMPEIEQNQLARIFLEEIESEQRWDLLFANSEIFLGEMANEAIKEFETGSTKLPDTDSL